MNDELTKTNSANSPNPNLQGAAPSRDLRVRTKAFALRIVRLYSALPKTTESQVLGKQMLRSGTSVGAHYREAKRARSAAEFVSKIEVGLQDWQARHLERRLSDILDEFGQRVMDTLEDEARRINLQGKGR